MGLRRVPLPYPDLPFHDLLDAAAFLRPERIALLFEEERYTYRELLGMANALANGLEASGIGHGDRVALYMTNRPEWIASFFALSKVGASAVLVSPAWKQFEVEHAFSLTQPVAVIADGAGCDVVDAVGSVGRRYTADETGGGWVSLRSLMAGRSGVRTTELNGDLATMEVALPFSSGTTGLPKAVRHSHRTLFTGTVQWIATLNLTDADAMQTFSPLAHILGVVNVAACIGSGATIRLFRRLDLRVMLDSIARDHITVGVAVAPLAAAMADLPDLEDYDLSSMRYFGWAATPVAEAVANRFTERTGLRWLTAYGATESPVLFANPVLRPELWRVDSPGLPGPDVEPMIIDPETHAELPAGERGEIVVRNASTMLGYLPEDANELAFLPGGWYRTGDVGWLEPDGWLHITDRLKEMIKVSGFQVAPGELEAALLEHPDVADCAVFGVPDGPRGQAPHAAIVGRTGASPDPAGIIVWMSERLAGYKRLAAVHVLDEIPRTASGKTLRRTLVDQFG